MNNIYGKCSTASLQIVTVNCKKLLLQKLTDVMRNFINLQKRNKKIYLTLHIPT